MLRPMIQAPRFSNDRSARSLSTPVVPPSFPITLRWKVRVGMNHPCKSSPPRPSGRPRLWPAPAPKPSADTVKAFTRSLDMVLLVNRDTERAPRSKDQRQRDERHVREDLDPPAESERGRPPGR